MPYEYKVIACYEAGEATTALNKYAAEGYRLVQVAPSGNHSVLVMEREKSLTRIEPSNPMHGFRNPTAVMHIALGQTVKKDSLNQVIVCPDDIQPDGVAVENVPLGTVVEYFTRPSPLRGVRIAQDKRSADAEA